jgi:pyruvate kinase
MIMAGMNIARFNFSHGTHEYQFKLLSNLREALKLCPEKECKILLDTKGPEIRTKLLQTDSPVEVHAGEDLDIYSTVNISNSSSNKSIGCSLESLTKCVNIG